MGKKNKQRFSCSDFYFVHIKFNVKCIFSEFVFLVLRKKKRKGNENGKNEKGKKDFHSRKLELSTVFDWKSRPVFEYGSREAHRNQEKS